PYFSRRRGFGGIGKGFHTGEPWIVPVETKATVPAAIHASQLPARGHGKEQAASGTLDRHHVTSSAVPLPSSASLAALQSLRRAKIAKRPCWFLPTLHCLGRIVIEVRIMPHQGHPGQVIRKSLFIHQGDDGILGLLLAALQSRGGQFQLGSAAQG